MQLFTWSYVKTLAAGTSRGSGLLGNLFLQLGEKVGKMFWRALLALSDSHCMLSPRRVGSVEMGHLWSSSSWVLPCHNPQTDGTSDSSWLFVYFCIQLKNLAIPFWWVRPCISQYLGMFRDSWRSQKNFFKSISNWAWYPWKITAWMFAYWSSNLIYIYLNPFHVGGKKKKVYKILHWF